MSDFDFDELDKAVAGALTPDDTASGAPRESHSEESENTTEQSAPRRDTPEVSGPSEPVVTPKPAPAARRGSGRFMDVVHPSSDMRSQTSSFTPPSRAPKEVKDEPALPLETVSSSDLEFEDTLAQPLDSPFLPDAKVEKRPLGAFSEAAASQETLATQELLPPFEDELLLEAPDDPLIEAHALPDPIDFAAHASALPTESEDTGTPTVEVQEEVTEEEPVVLEDTVAPEAATPVVEDEAPKVVHDEPAGPASISQQYTEKPSSAPSSGAIYDTENYHKPLAPAPKKKSGIWTFIWILLLIILGAGAGVAFYLYILPLLSA